MSCSNGNFSNSIAKPVSGCEPSYMLTRNTNIGDKPCCLGLKRCSDRASGKVWCTNGTRCNINVKENFKQPGCGAPSYNMSPVGIL